jgi:Relaxase/Mobilisation nuclease domain/RepB DNA-primase from phage plasmid
MVALVIVKQMTGSDFRGVISYAMQPKKNPRIIGGSVGGQNQSIADIVHKFTSTQKLRPSLEKCVHHAAIAFKCRERQSDYQLKVLAREYLQRMGWELDKTRWVLIRHNDTEHHHAHLIASRIQMNAQVVSDKFSWVRGLAVCRQLEEEHGLEPVSSQPKREHKMSAAEQQMCARLEKAGGVRRVYETGERGEKEQSRKNVFERETINKPVAQTLEELKNALREASINVQSLNEFTTTLAHSRIDVKARFNTQGKVLGLSYQLDGHNFRASTLGANFTWQHLQQKGHDHERQRDEQWHEQWWGISQLGARRGDATYSEFRENQAASITFTDQRGVSSEFAPEFTFTAVTVVDWQVSTPGKEFGEPVTSPPISFEEPISVFSGAIEHDSTGITGTTADLLPSDGVQTTSDGLILLSGDRQSDQETEFDYSNTRNQEPPGLEQSRPDRGTGEVQGLASPRPDIREHDPEDRSDFQQHDAESDYPTAGDEGTLQLDDRGDYDPRLPTKTNAKISITPGDWLDSGNGINPGDVVLLSTVESQQSPRAVALDDLRAGDRNPGQARAAHESRGTQTGPEVPSGDKQQVGELPVGLIQHERSEEGRPGEIVGEINSHRGLHPLGQAALQKKEDSTDSTQKPLAQELTEREEAEVDELQRQEEEEEIDDWQPSNVGQKDLLMALQATGIEGWKVKLHDPTNPDLPVQNYVLDTRTIGSRQAQFRDLHTNLGMQIEVSPADEEHGLLVIDHLRMGQAAKLRAEVPLAAIIRTGGDRCQVWLRHSQQMSPAKRLALQAEYIERFGGRAGNLRLVGIDQKVELLIADPGAVVRLDDMSRGTGSILACPVPPQTEASSELARYREWVAEELSEVLFPESSEMEMSWDANRDQLRFHNGPWVSDELDNRELIDFCLFIEQVKEDEQQQLIWEQEQQEKSGLDFER